MGKLIFIKADISDVNITNLCSFVCLVFKTQNRKGFNICQELNIGKVSGMLCRVRTCCSYCRYDVWISYFSNIPSI